MPIKHCVWRYHVKLKTGPSNQPQPASCFWPTEQMAQERANLHRVSDQEEIGKYCHSDDKHIPVIRDRRYRVRHCRSVARCACQEFVQTQRRGNAIGFDTPDNPFWDTQLRFRLWPFGKLWPFRKSKRRVKRRR